MTRQGRASDAGAGRDRMPASVRRALFVGVALAIAGALYLIVVRGEALLADLKSLAALCF